MKKSFTIYFTSDTHGHVFPVNYAANTAEDSGLLNLACQIEKGGDALYLDGGDSLQGTPFSQYCLAHPTACAAHPIAAAFNALKLDYFTLGNHDFNFGYEALKRYLCSMNAVCLCANLQDQKGELPFKAYAVHTLENGLRVGITGVVTDYVNVWEQPQNLAHLRITDALEAAGNTLALLRPQCDVCVCIYHGGFEEELATGRLLSSSSENLACKLARELKFDLLLTGHQHMAVAGVQLGGTWAVQPPANAGQYVRIEGRFDGARCRFSSALLPAGSSHPPQPYESLLPLEKKVQLWLDEPIGTLAQPIPPEEKLPAALQGSQVAALFNQVQLEATRADFSCTSLGNAPVGLASPVTMRGVTSAYLFSNTLVVLEVTEKALRAALERCAAYFALDEGRPRVSDAFLLPKIEHYNYDFFAGLAYTFDLRRPVGSRVVRLARLDGSPLGPGPFRLCTSNYRATGTGGYEALRECPVLWRGSVEMPELVARYIQSHSPVPRLHNAELEVVW